MSAGRTYLKVKWQSMRERCERTSHPNYHRYGGRGIAVCAEWHDFEAFYQWSIQSGFSIGLGVDRIDSNLGYCPENCRWATRSQQNSNIHRKRGRWIFRGVTKHYRQWRVSIQQTHKGFRKNIIVGDYGTKLKAALIYDAAATFLYGEFSVLNFPERVRAGVVESLPAKFFGKLIINPNAKAST